jgi:hypothetical protein
MSKQHQLDMQVSAKNQQLHTIQSELYNKTQELLKLKKQLAYQDRSLDSQEAALRAKLEQERRSQLERAELKAQLRANELA